MAAEKNSWSFRRRLLFDFHMPDFLEELKVDVPEYLADLKEINAQSLTLMTKSSFGNCYYQSRIGQKAKGLKGDLLKKMIPRLRQQGMEVIAYYNASLSDIESQKHPEWRAINSQGQKVRFEYYDQLCLNSPLKEFVVQQAREIVENYEVDGFWLDLTYMAAGGCFCPWCQKLFQERYGLKLTPEIKKDPASNRLFQEFRRSSRFDFIKAVHTALKEIKPSLLLGWNHAGDFYFNEIEIDRLADYSSVEFHPPLYAEGSIRARYLRKLGKPFELMIPETLSGWGDWTLLPEPTMKLMATLCLMHGGSINIGHVVPPCGEFAGRLAPAVKQTIKKTFRWVKKIAPFCTGESVPINAIFYSAENSRLVNALPEAESDFSRNSLNTLFGLGKILLASQLHFDVLGQEQISQIHRYEVLLLPDIRYLSPGVEKEIITYVEKGGKLLATYLSGFWDQQGQLRSDSPAARLFGVRFENFSPYSINYLYHFDKKIAAGLPDMPILVNQTPPDKRSDRRSVLVRPTTAQVLAYLVEPVIESDHEHYFHIYHRYSPPGKTTRYPAIT
ncbi:MAG TPA: family 10 glycosylhydrolase, partial [bacterium]|nr:family 10 glycosylhydrolase [bacterium]